MYLRQGEGVRLPGEHISVYVCSSTRVDSGLQTLFQNNVCILVLYPEQFS